MNVTVVHNNQYPHQQEVYKTKERSGTLYSQNNLLYISYPEDVYENTVPFEKVMFLKILPLCIFLKVECCGSFDADPDPACHFDANPEQVRILHFTLMRILGSK
jgi:hypothetical protein